jgi:hypothetical protein
MVGCGTAVGALFHASRWSLHRLLRAWAPSSIQYPLEFKFLTGVVFCGTGLWFAVFILAVLPILETNGDVQFNVTARSLCIYLIWFIFLRAIFLLPRVSNRWAQWYSQATQCKACCAKFLLWDWPLYMFLVNSLILLLRLIFLAHAILSFYAAQSCMLGVLLLFQAFWHNRLMGDAIRRRCSKKRAAPPDTINHLETCAYDESAFGDVEGRIYPGECAICLEIWQPSDSIKVTPCRHAFHEACLASWLQTSCTCAMCRLDLVKAVEDLKTSGPAIVSDDASLSQL